MDAELYKSLLSLHTKIDRVKDDMESMSEKFNSLSCAVNTDRIKRLEKVVYGIVSIILIAWAASTINWNSGPKKVIAKTPVAVVKKVK